MTKILITGATGELGKQLRPRLIAAGYDVRGTSRRPVEQAQKLDPQVEWVQADFVSKRGWVKAFEDVNCVIHAASAAFGQTRQVDVEGTAHLLQMAKKASVDHFFYISIVGIDRIPFSYYQHKLAAENLIEAADVPWTILRATQFHSLLDMFFHGLAKLPIMMLPAEFQFQLIDPGEVADVMVQAVGAGPVGRLPDLGGPVVQRAGELVQPWLAHQPFSRRVWRLPLPGKVGAGFRAGYNTVPERPSGSVTWADWLQQKYGRPRLETAV
ncbi:SDR family oxidoreductase [Candidatus Leptofilum sp.]|uniref:SDR family oxidoreductase n=1 Tax=Candidatus Leptofilum sp. TaxID=3241576 RepID=UPI003B5C5261